MILRNSILSLIATTALAVAVPAQQLVNLPVGTWANDITPDGETVVGTSNVGGFIWRWQVDAEPTYVPGGDMVAVSDDGSVVLGNIWVGGSPYAALWTEDGGWDALDFSAFSPCGPSVSSGYALSGDGKSATGLGWNGCDARGFLWTEAGGVQMLDSLGNGSNRASAISRDGQVIGGFAQGSFNRTPAVWASDGSGWLYNVNDLGEVHGLNNDGSVILGEYNGRAFMDDGSGITILGSLNGGNWTGIATDISEDGQTVVGYDTVSLARQAWMWTPATGIVSMNDVMANAGYPGAADTFVCRAMTDDGNVIVGGTLADGGGPFGFGGFIFEREDTETWEDLGHALAGSNGLPHITGTGDLSPLSGVSLMLTNALPNGSAWLIMGSANISAPFKGGVQVPSPEILLGPLSVRPSGDLPLAAHWPAGMPGDVTTYMQYWIPDAGGPYGYAASNALAATTP
ncbi:MAG: hypothetical protein DRQ55_17985 [Planctomycetota bacterium]|nr:MAG: hypothetical protein DRQ55_17985 [Planctomycetota bacterium]